ncbi:uncharacterized protein LOC123506771 [Portunus trituberculatus]|uniref:uncharacterized protein LOC123506771 n=1 Tax=Portunus trituberculatus TaxID=210409 RepID=UPI001E1D1092|nr:uncharacterized protein LOC123506771 [Portunus trituberculatus]XP_045115038.1 uncharacterized protein LOC123506771 [Portunus trituberculatus]XP_045115039.1 uncharacterized protein LOC123506771 [Portunus trituberculatus]XP_045115040.1 uncharacterized protein LOC123506771 [Portunus trituberculatus]XP_045115041.1 uncharacterized protein LOC123506771 [Portunus trituberculatus]
MTPTKRPKLHDNQPKEDPQAVLSHLEVLRKECRKENPDILLINRKLERTFNHRRTRVHAENVTVVDILTEFPVLRQRNFFTAEACLCGILQPHETWDKLHSSLPELCKHTQRRSKKYRLYNSRYIEYLDSTLLESRGKIMDYALPLRFFHPFSRRMKNCLLFRALRTSRPPLLFWLEMKRGTSSTSMENLCFSQKQQSLKVGLKPYFNPTGYLLWSIQSKYKKLCCFWRNTFSKCSARYQLLFVPGPKSLMFFIEQ